MKITEKGITFVIIVGLIIFIVNTVHSCTVQEDCIWNKIPLTECK